MRARGRRGGKMAARALLLSSQRPDLTSRSSRTSNSSNMAGGKRAYLHRLRTLQRQVAAGGDSQSDRIPAIWGHSPGEVEVRRGAERSAHGGAPTDADDSAAVGLPATSMEEFHFDLNGFVILRGAISAAEVASINRALDELPKMKLGDWLGHAHMTAGPGDISLMQVYELGPVFERLIDHPAYFEKLRRFIGGSGWDNQHNGGLLTIDEAFANFRATGAGPPLRSFWPTIIYKTDSGKIARKS